MLLQQVPAVKDLLRKCVRCGKCRSVCPIFKEIKNEGAAPRAHVFLTQLMRDGELEADRDVAKRASRCLLCKSCSSECPSGIPVDQMVVAMRHHLNEYNQDSTKKLMLNHMFKDRKTLGRARLLLQGYQSTGLKNIVQKSGLLGMMSKDLEQANKMIAPVSGSIASKSIPETAPAQGKREIKVGYFLGCATNMFYPHRARDTVEVLTANGCEVFTPRKLQCCGMPHIANGDTQSAQAMTLENFKLFYDADVDVIVSDCASCSSMLQGDFYDQLFDKMPEEIVSFKDKVYDLNKFLMEKITLNQELGHLPKTAVTYHDPCHLVKSQGVTKAPRQILSLIPGVEISEMVGADQCCGGAGTFSMSHYDLSRRILDGKMDAVKNTGASVLATSCPACSMQLGHGLAEHGLELDIKHPVELLAQAYRQAKQSSKIS